MDHKGQMPLEEANVLERGQPKSTSNVASTSQQTSGQDVLNLCCVMPIKVLVRPWAVIATSSPSSLNHLDL